MDELMARIDVVKAQMKGKAADAKLAVKGQLEVLENVRENLESRMRQLRTAAPGAWREIQDGLDHAMEEVDHALERAGEKLEET